MKRFDKKKSKPTLSKIQINLLDNRINIKNFNCNCQTFTYVKNFLMPFILIHFEKGFNILKNKSLHFHNLNFYFKGTEIITMIILCCIYIYLIVIRYLLYLSSILLNNIYKCSCVVLSNIRGV